MEARACCSGRQWILQHFISLRVVISGFDATLSGLVLSSYFLGFTVAALRAGRMIERIRHIRAYAAFAVLVVAATAAMPLSDGSPGGMMSLVWMILRALIGFGCAGLFVATESWLNAKALRPSAGACFQCTWTRWH